MTLLLLACTADPPPVDAVDSPPDSPPLDLEPEVPLLESPALAQDLDPSDDVLHVALTAAETDVGYAYNGQAPGPTLRAKVGETLVVDLTNDLDVDTTIHWHGVHVPYAMDGVTWQADPVAPGASFTYTFVLDRPGTYWYHPHFDTERQVDLGLYGVLIVEDPADPVPERELVVVADIAGESHEDPPPPHEGAAHGFEVTSTGWTMNGLSAPNVQLEPGQRLVVHLLNASNVGYLALSDVTVVGTDQGTLAAPLDEVVLGPGDRAVLEVTGDVSTAPRSLAGEGFGDDELLFTVSGSDATPLSWPHSGASPSPDPGHTDVLYTFHGDEHTGEWLINGESYPDITVETLELGTTGVIEVRNLSPTEHPFHLHGMHFEVLSIDGVPPAHKTVEDTLNVPIRGAARLLVDADNPGDWMTHCHILPHAHGGMMTVLRVE